ncbi:hypothetical protein [Azospirillum largimobile]
MKSPRKARKSGHTTGFFRMLERDNAPHRGKIRDISCLSQSFQ